MPFPDREPRPAHQPEVRGERVPVRRIGHQPDRLAREWSATGEDAKCADEEREAQGEEELSEHGGGRHAARPPQYPRGEPHADTAESWA